jgi:CheY-like chemotaxis protein
MAVVLVVEDDVELLPILSEALSDAGWKVIGAASVSAALEAVRSGPVDVVLTDLWMPGIGGDALEATFRRDAVLRTVPFVFMTGSHEKAQELRLRARVVLKPFAVRDVVAMLASCLPLVDRASPHC